MLADPEAVRRAKEKWQGKQGETGSRKRAQEAGRASAGSGRCWPDPNNEEGVAKKGKQGEKREQDPEEAGCASAGSGRRWPDPNTEEGVTKGDEAVAGADPSVGERWRRPKDAIECGIWTLPLGIQIVGSTSPTVQTASHRRTCGSNCLDRQRVDPN